MTRSSGIDLRPYYPNGMAAWRPDSLAATGLANALHGTSLAAPEREFARAALNEGVLIDGEVIGDGKIHRVPHIDSKRGEKDAWYVLFTMATSRVALSAHGKGWSSPPHGTRTPVGRSHGRSKRITRGAWIG